MANGIEPSNGELARRLDGIASMLDKLISRDQYAADQRGANYRFGELAEDVAGVRRDFTDAIRTVHERISAAERMAAEHRASWRTVIYTGLVPAAIVAVSIAAQLWIATHGGH